jgi:uncharacterized protein YbjT (DUF2867 family)
MREAGFPMKVLILGATGMIGQGALREALLDGRVDEVVTLGRQPTGKQHPKLREIVHADLTNLTPVERQLAGLDACFFCIGVTSAGMSEAAYTKITYDLTMAVASTLVRVSPAMTFIFVSGKSTDATEQGRVMWARVKGRAENALRRMPFKATYMFRPGVIVPMHGIQSRTTLYRVLYSLTRPLWPVMHRLFPRSITTTEQIGRAMITVAQNGYEKLVLEAKDITRF